MKINEPVTGNEIPYPEGATLVSKTDKKGIITYCNRAFIEISGFSEVELIGKNHNLVRHPDMPPAAFKDLWDTVKRGEPWTGLVKNRAKNGDHYWVRANVTPIREHGQVVGYMSVRSKPGRDEVAGAESLYRDINAGRASLDDAPLTRKLNVFSRMKLMPKFASLMAIMLIPMVIMLAMLVDEMQATISFAEKEVQGVEYLQPLRQLQQHLAQHRGLNNVLKNGKDVSDKVAATAAKVAADVKAVDDINAELGGVLEVDSNWTKVKSTWLNLKSEVPSLPAKESFARHTALIADVHALMARVGDTSNLILDPELDTYYLMDMLVVRLPYAMEESGVLRGRGSGIAAAGAIDTSTQLELSAKLYLLESLVNAAIRSAEVAIENNPALADEIKAPIAEMQAKFTPFTESLRQVLQGDVTGVDAVNLFAQGTAAISAGFKVYDIAAVQLTDLLQERQAEVGTKLTTSLVLILVVVALSLLIAWIILRGVTAPVMRIRQALGRLQEGDFNNDITCYTRDEIGDTMRALQSMQIRLGFDVMDAKEKADAASRIQTALDAVSTNVMLADPERNIIYMNESAKGLFKEVEADLQEDLPNFRADALIGTNIDGFHKNPAHQIGLLDKLDGRFESDLNIGTRTLKIIATAVKNQDGERLGTAVEWTDLTEKLRLEAEAERAAEKERQIAEENMRIRVALDNVSSGVMMADVDTNIIYTNKAVMKLFRDAQHDIRKDLPNFDAETLMGTSFDVFHKNPAHQQQMLKQLSGTHLTEIVVGGRTLKINANPVISAEGERLGTVVEWTDRTSEVAIEHEVEGIIIAAGSGDMSQRISTADKTGFFLDISNGINTLLGNLGGVFEDVNHVMSRIANGDLTSQISADYQGVFGELKTNIHSTLENLSSTVNELREASDSIRSGASEIMNGNNSLSSRTEQQAASLEETASSMEELTSTVRHNADNAEQANQLSAQAQTTAAKGGDVVARAVHAMEEINRSSKEIAEIIGVIDEIAFQTNLLALNASVEAARAGEQGRGFAVVATEVRNLAGRSASAAKEIKELIQSSVKRVDAGSQLVNESGETLSEIVTNVKKVGDIIGEIAAASRQQASGIDQVNIAVSQMDEMTQQNAALAEETSAASVSLSEKAGDMDRRMAFFTTP